MPMPRGNWSRLSTSLPASSSSTPTRAAWPIAETALKAYKLAYATDTTSAFGGIIAFNRELDAESAAQITTNQFVELIIAPCASEAALKVTAAKQNVRVLTVPLSNAHNQFDFKRVSGGLLVQTPDALNVQASQLKVVSKLQPTREQLRTFCSRGAWPNM